MELGARRTRPRAVVVAHVDAHPLQRPLARRIASLGKPMLVVMEGGYAVDALGGNVAAFLGGL